MDAPHCPISNSASSRSPGTSGSSLRILGSGSWMLAARKALHSFPSFEGEPGKGEAVIFNLGHRRVGLEQERPPLLSFHIRELGGQFLEGQGPDARKREIAGDDDHHL